MTSSSPHHPETAILREIDLGRHILLLMSDQRIDLMQQKESPFGVTCILSLDHDETYRLLLCLQDLFRPKCE